MTYTPYLQPSEYATYGISDASAAQVASACMVVDTYLARPEGLLWSPDANGAPAILRQLRERDTNASAIAGQPTSRLMPALTRRKPCGPNLRVTLS